MKTPSLRRFAATTLSILLALSVPLGSAGLPVRVGADTSGDYEYTVDGGTGEATIDLYTGTGSSVAVPSTFGGAPVTAIGPGAFSANATLTDVTLPSGIAAIGDGAFASCPLLAKALFLGNAPTLGTGVFADADAAFTVLYLSSATGFSTPTWNGYPAAILTVPVHFDLQDGSTPSTVDVNSGETVPAPSSDPTWTGHVFGGWFADAAGTVPWNFATTTVSTETTIYAAWTLGSFTATFVNGNGDPDTLVTQDYGTDVYAPATDPTWTGYYTFAGWYYDDGTFLDAATFPFPMPDGGTTLYAKWNPVDYAITFKPNNGGDDVTVTRGYGTSVAAPTQPTLTGYVFGGWFRDNGTFADPVTFPYAMPYGGETLYAKWTIGSFTATFVNGNGDPDTLVTQDFGTPVTEPTPPTRTGYTFDAWYLDEAFTQPATFPFAMPENGITIYAKWTLNDYTVTFKPNNGGDDIVVTQGYGTSVAAPTQPLRTGYVFGGWFTDDGTFLDEVTFPSAMPYGGATLYAKWTIGTFTATFVNGNGGADTLVTQDYNTDVYAPLSNPERTGYTFGGWFTDDGTFANAAAFPFAMPEGGTTLYAKWTLNDYMITFKPNNGGDDIVVTQGYGTSVAAPTPPTRTGYVFGGWFTDDGTFLNEVTFPSAMPFEGATLYAKWTIAEISSGTFTVNGTSGYLSKIAAGTTVDALLAGLAPGVGIRVFKGATEITGAALVGTGTTVQLMDGDTVLQTLTIIVTGDVSGDGRVTLLDFAQLQAHLLGTSVLTDAWFLAGDVSGDGRVTLLDFAQLQSFLLGRSDIVPNSY